jgi:hypothetical protein
MQTLFTTTNEAEFAQHLEAGYCFGMSCDWAQKSLKSQRGQGVKYKDQLEEFKWVIGQTAYETNKGVTDQGLISGMGLNVQGHYSGAIASWGALCNFMYNTAGLGTFLFCIDGPGGGHAMGYRRVKMTDVLGRSKDSLQWLDPNIGLMDFSNMGDFTTNVSAKLDELYGSGESDPNERLDQNYELFKVTV